MATTLPPTTTDRPVEAAPGQRRVGPAFIDCDHHPELDSVKDLYPFLAQRWRDHIDTYGARGAAGGFYPRFMDHIEDARPPSGRRSGSEYAFVKTNFLDRWNMAYGILTPLSPAGRQLNHDLSAALATATNDWLVAEWLDPEPRYRSSIIISHEDTPAAVAEIKRRAGDKRFVQVQFSGRPQEPMGRRRYWPIYEACVEHGLAVMSHAFGSYGNPITGTGWPSFYIEDHVGPAQAMQGNVSSMVLEGVFETFPTLNVVSVENGFFWLPSLMWRLDAAWSLLKSETPHLKRAPSEYIRERVYLSTQPMEEPHKRQHFLQTLAMFGANDRVMFATDYPHWDWDAPDMAFPVSLPPAIERAILVDNAARLYGLEV
ncbi:MAG: amidohydrolase [Chloroflexi bacterium]|nr:amidohydrolase [Chloroflexota bacterium]